MDRRRVGSSDPIFGIGLSLFGEGPHGHHHHNPHSMTPPPIIVQMEAPRHHEELEAERLRLETERLRVQERCQLEEQRLREEQARLNAERELRRLEWEREAPEREARRQLEEEQRLESEAQRREIEAKLAEAQRAQANLHAEEVRQNEAKRRVQTKIEEDQAEEKRVSVYDAHSALIVKASLLELFQLQKEIEALGCLTSPIPCFADSQKKGMPLASDGKTTLFLSILNNKKFGNEIKYQLLHLLITSKGYAGYVNYLFSSPILNLLVADAQPKELGVNEHGAVIQPDPFILLVAAFRDAVVLGINFSQTIESEIYPTLIMRGYGSDIFKYHYDTKTPIQIMQFLAYWRSSCADPNQTHNNLFSAYKDMKDEVYQLLKADYMNVQFVPPVYMSHYESLARLLSSVGASKARMTSLLQEWYQWCERCNPNDMIGFANVYAGLLTLSKKEECLEMDKTFITKIMQINEEVGQQFYERLKSNKVSRDALMWILKIWLGAFEKPHDFVHVKVLYQNLIKDAVKPIKEEGKVLEVLLGFNPFAGVEIFSFLIENNVSKTKLMQFMDIWLDALSNDEAIRSAYKQVKQLIKDSSLNGLRFPIRAIAEINTLKLIIEQRIIKDEPATKKFLAVRSPGLIRSSFFCISHCGSKPHSSRSAYEALREDVREGRDEFNIMQRKAQREINQAVKVCGEEGSFEFRP